MSERTMAHERLRRLMEKERQRRETEKPITASPPDVRRTESVLEFRGVYRAYTPPEGES